VEAGKKAAGEVLALQKRVLSVLNEARWVISECVLFCLISARWHCIQTLFWWFAIFSLSLYCWWIIPDWVLFCLFLFIFAPYSNLVLAVYHIWFVPAFSCKEPIEPLTLAQIAERCHAVEQACNSMFLAVCVKIFVIFRLLVKFTAKQISIVIKYLIHILPLTFNLYAD
jgi:hypothetical protein